MSNAGYPEKMCPPCEYVSEGEGCMAEGSGDQHIWSKQMEISFQRGRSVKAPPVTIHYITL